MTPKEQERLDSCDERLKELFLVVKRSGYPCLIIEGHRNEQRQNEAFEKGFSKKKWPEGEHNKMPSRAIDVAPLKNGKIDWNDWHKFYHFAGFVQGIAYALGIKIRSGLDWDSDFDLKDQTFMDAPHFEVVD